MAYIYKITNKINGKIYIGQTRCLIEKRFTTHLQDSKRYKYKTRPLYMAINKYGIENFKTEIIEETDKPYEREMYWIQYYDSFKNGYNATIGGGGRKIIDDNIVVNSYLLTHNCVETANILNIHVDTVRDILHKNNINVTSSGEIAANKNGKRVIMKDGDGNIINIFNNQMDAARWLKDNDESINSQIKHLSTSIGRVAKGERKTCCGYKWEWI